MADQLAKRDSHSSGDVEKSAFGHQQDTPQSVVLVEADNDAHLGVARLEAAAKVWGKYSKWVLFISFVPLPSILSQLQSILTPILI